MSRRKFRLTQEIPSISHITQDIILHNFIFFNGLTNAVSILSKRENRNILLCNVISGSALLIHVLCHRLFFNLQRSFFLVRSSEESSARSVKK